MKKCIRSYFQEEMRELNDRTREAAIVDIIQKLVDFTAYEKPIANKMYKMLFVRKYARSEVIKMRKERPEVTKLDPSDEYYGDPLYSLATYFEFFEEPGQEYSNTSDWFEYRGVDYLSTKLDLVNNVVIVEYRDFPYQCFLNTYMNGNARVRHILDTETIYEDLNLSIMPISALVEFITPTALSKTRARSTRTRTRTVSKLGKTRKGSRENQSKESKSRKSSKESKSRKSSKESKSRKSSKSKSKINVVSPLLFSQQV